MPTYQPDRIPRDGCIQWIILDLLLARPGPWGVGELVDVIGSPVAVAEALDALHAAGLIDRIDAFVKLGPAR